MPQFSSTMKSAFSRRIFDVVVIGGGVVGCAIARLLGRYQIRAALVEKESDVSMGASCRNSGVIHAGINYPPGSLRAKLCMEGRALLIDWCEELGVPYRITGKLVIALSRDQIADLEKLLVQGSENGVDGLRILERQEMESLQPGVQGIAALHVPTTGIVSPYALTIALAEDAATNGVAFFLDCEAHAIEHASNSYTVRTSSCVLTARCVVNASGIFADKLGQSLEGGIPAIYPCRGQYLVLDTTAGESLRMPIYPVPPRTSGGLGVHITPTVDGNVLLGPSAEYVDSRNTYACTREVLDGLQREAAMMLPCLSTSSVIASYSGLRAKLSPPEEGGYCDFFIAESRRYPGVINLIGLESPALTAAPAIAQLVLEMIKPSINLEKKPAGMLHLRKWYERFDALPEEKKERLVKECPDYGEVICRCEGVTKHEVLQALRNPLGVKTLVGLKYRCRVMMGRCGGGYCLPRIVEILQEELKWEPHQILLRGKSSPVFAGWVK